MKQISLRQFRDTIQDLREPVSVSVRRDDALVTLGTWTPQGAKIAYRDTWPDTEPGFGHPVPAPKPK